MRGLTELIKMVPGGNHMLVSKYQLKSPCAAVRDCKKVIQLPVGSLIFPNSTSPDAAGMIECTCDGHTVRMFACDLDERAERIEIRRNPAKVQAIRTVPGRRSQARS